MDENKIKIQFGQVIKEFRSSKNMSQERLGEIVGLHRTYISEVERGVRNVSLVNIVKIARGLDTNPSEIFLDMEKNLKKH